MEIHPIRTDKDHRAALAEIEKLWGASSGTPEGDKLDILVTLVETYEERRWPLRSRCRFDPVDVLRYTIEELGHKPGRACRHSGLAFACPEQLARMCRVSGVKLLPQQIVWIGARAYNRLFGVLWHEAFELNFGILVLEVSLARPPKYAGEFRPGV
jgi:HTH-type transcriptional regulator/antitoxin HigA